MSSSVRWIGQAERVVTGRSAAGRSLLLDQIPDGIDFLLAELLIAGIEQGGHEILRLPFKVGAQKAVERGPLGFPGG